MNKNALKSYAVWARQKLINDVAQKAFEYAITKDGFGEENAKAIGERALSNDEVKQRSELVNQIKLKGFEQVMEEVAYTWFNRFIALRYMEVNGFLPSRIRVFTNENNEFKPEILKEAINIDFECIDKSKVFELIDSNDTDALYKYLIISQCNDLGKLLPGMFEKIANYTELLFPDNLLRPDSVIGKMISDIDESDWGEQVEILGWLYQYYISEKHSSVIDIKGGKAIKKEDVPAATQLFTTHWVVQYMVDNSLGRYWIERNPESDLKSKLKFYVEPENFTTVDEKISPEDLTVFDPCMGSGHILVYAFEVLMQIYLECGYTERDATSLILENNLFGLDIDDRAYQLAYFAVMMKARSYDRRILTRNIKPNVYSIKESNFLVDSWQKISDDEKFREIFQTVVDTFINAKEYGSILNVPDSDYDYALSVIDNFEQSVPVDFEAQILRGKTDDICALVNQAKLMAKKYTAVVTNPPYMNKFDAKLKMYIADNFAEYKGDLFSVFMYHNFSFCTPDGYLAFMTPNVWMFIKSYEALRKYIINYKGISSLIQMAKGAFFKEATVDICSFVLSNRHHNVGNFIRLEGFKGDMEVQKQKVIEALTDKSCGYYYEADQSNFSKIPGSPIAYWLSKKLLTAFSEDTIGDVAKPRQGLATGDNNRFLRLWHEIEITKFNSNCTSRENAAESKKKWFPCNKGGAFRKWYGNNDYVVNWENDGFEIRNFKDENGKLRSRPQNMNYYFKEGMTWSTISSSSLSMRYSPKGFMFETKGSVCFANDDSNLKYLLAMMNTPIVAEILLALSPTLDFHEGPLAKVPALIDTSVKTEVTALADENMSISKQDWDSFETSWDFKKSQLV